VYILAEFLAVLSLAAYDRDGGSWVIGIPDISLKVSDGVLFMESDRTALRIT